MSGERCGPSDETNKHRSYERMLMHGNREHRSQGERGNHRVPSWMNWIDANGLITIAILVAPPNKKDQDEEIHSDLVP